MKTQSKDDIGLVKSALKTRNLKRVRLLCKEMNAADIAESFEGLDIAKAVVFFRLVNKERRAEVFSYLPFERQEEMLAILPDIVIIALLNQMEPVDRTKLLEELPDEIGQRFIQRLSPEERKIAWQLLSYPEDSIGRIMSPEFVALKESAQVSEALEYIRWNAARIPETALHHIFIIDDENHLVGHVHLAALVAADPPAQALKDIMDTTQNSLEVTATETEAVDFFRKYDTPCIAVVDEGARLVGVVEVDDVFDVAEEEATEDIQQFGGQDALEDSYFQTSIWDLIKKRAGWLAVLFVGMMFTANALEHFEGAIKSMSFLVFFLPLIISSGGNSGSQAASLMIRGFAVREIALGDWLKVFSREIVIGLGLGLILGGLGYLRVILGGQEGSVGLVVACSLVGVVAFGAIVGSMLPFILKAIRLDPAVSSSPVIASLVDIVGIIMFFNIAIFFMRYFKLIFQ